MMSKWQQGNTSGCHQQSLRLSDWFIFSVDMTHGNGDKTKKQQQ